jgi:hypothetical protein
MVTINVNAPQISSKRDRKKIIGPITLYNGKRLEPTMSMRDPWAAKLSASPHSPFSVRPV